jgi:hypothetical protein
MNIYIPTLGRAGKQTTLSRLPKKWRDHVTLVVHPKEVAAHFEHGARAVLPCPAQGQGIAAVRDWILSMAKRRGQERIVMLDDDLTFQRRRADMKITNLEDHEFDEAFVWLDAALKTFAHASFGVRALMYDSTEMAVRGGRAMHVLGYNLKMVETAGAYFSKGMSQIDMPVMSDFNMTLQLLKTGYPNIISLDFRVSPYSSNAPGGCQLWRTKDRIEKSAKQLVRLHAPFAKLREKKAWNGVANDVQVDVTVQWKQALKHGEEGK